MNLYAVSPDPKYCAKYLDTKRLGWVGIKESAQLIATALHELYGVETPVKPTHKNHPVAVWVRECPENLYWTTNYMLHCGYEYERRRHKEYQVKGMPAGKLWVLFRQICRDNGFTPKYIKTIPKDFCNCACRKDLGIDYRHITNVHDAYRMYLAHRWVNDKLMPVWH